MISSKSQFKNPDQEEAELLCYEHIFMVELKNDLGWISQKLVLKS